MPDLNSSGGSFNSTFFLSLGTMITAAIGVCLAYALKSKCSSVKCCCVEIIRDIDAELEEGPTPVPGSATVPLPVPVPEPERRPTSHRRDSFIDTRVAEALKKYHSSLSIHALNRPTRSNSFT